MIFHNQQSPFLTQGVAQGAYGFPRQQQAFSGQGLQSGMLNAGYAPVSNAWSYRLQPSANAMSTGISQQQAQSGIAQQQGGQFIQGGQASVPMSSAAMMQQQSTGIISPEIDISETKNDLVVACSIPNANLNNLNLTATENSLSISAQAFVGNQSTSMHRTIPLSTTIRSEAVDANYSNGILQVRMPKKETSSRKQLQVNTGNTSQ